MILGTAFKIQNGKKKSNGKTEIIIHYSSGLELDT